MKQRCAVWSKSKYLYMRRGFLGETLVRTAEHSLNMLLDLSLEILLTNIHKRFLWRIKNEIGRFRHCYIHAFLWGTLFSDSVSVLLNFFVSWASNVAKVLLNAYRKSRTRNAELLQVGPQDPGRGTPKCLGVSGTRDPWSGTWDLYLLYLYNSLFNINYT